MHRVYWALGLACLFSACGCDFDVKPVSVVVPAPPSLDDLPLAAHPEYDNWSKFPVGTKVVRKDNLASAEGEVILHTTLKLAKKSEQGVTIETQTAIERDGARQESDVSSADYPAQFRLPKGMAIEQFQLPMLKAKQIDSEKLLVIDKEQEMEVFTFEDQSEAGPVDVKLWRSDEVPGRQVKKEIVDRKGLVLSSSNIVEIVKP